MSTIAASTSPATSVPDAAALETKLEIVVLPVTDVDRAKRFYERLGWRLDADFAAGDAWRVVQLTPPGSPCSVLLGVGITTAAPGSAQGMFLVVDDVVAARAELARRGADVSPVFHFENDLIHVVGTEGRLPGADPAGRSYRSWASFSDPDGNGWIVQEIRTRLPGRGVGMDVVNLTELLREAENRHGDYEPTAPKHHWSAWYAAFIVARQRGAAADDAAGAAARHVEASRPSRPPGDDSR